MRSFFVSPLPGGVPQLLLDGEELRGRAQTTKGERGVRSSHRKSRNSQSARSMIGSSVTGNSVCDPIHHHVTCVYVCPPNMVFLFLFLNKPVCCSVVSVVATGRKVVHNR